MGARSAPAGDLLSVKQYGAAGDGKTDDTSAIRAALTDLEKAGIGGVLFFPRGTYTLTSPLSPTVAGVTFRGEGRRTSVLQGDIPTLINVGSGCNHFALRDLQLRCNRAGDGSIRMLALESSHFGLIDNCRFHLTKPRPGSYDDCAIHLSSSFYTSIRDSYIQCAATPGTSAHRLTGKEANLPGGTGLCSNNSNALYVTTCTFSYCGRGIHSLDDTGIMVCGGGFEQFNQGVYFTGKSRRNLVIGARFENHPEKAVQLLPRTDEQCDVYFDTGCERCQVIGVPYHLYDLHHPHNLAVIDKAEKGENSWEHWGGRGRLVEAGLLRNGDFSRWTAAGQPVAWTPTGAAALSEGTGDLPPEPGVGRVLEVTAAGNGHGVKTAPFHFDPAKSGTLSLRFWLKRTGGTAGVVRPQLFNEDADGVFQGQFGLFTNAGYEAADNFLWDEWQEYCVVRTTGLESAANVSIRFVQHGATPVTFLLGAVTALQGRHYQIPGVFEPPKLYGAAAPSVGAFAKGDVCWNSDPSAAGYIGWVCVEGGSPGVWKGFGAIEP
ncbi:MAG: hypothetical protein JW990_13655 [Thermoleophilia bacterium]|nr:hypothetical protein [Thermoleophilia bacterium]